MPSLAADVPGFCTSLDDIAQPRRALAELAEKVKLLSVMHFVQRKVNAQCVAFTYVPSLIVVVFASPVYSGGFDFDRARRSEEKIEPPFGQAARISFPVI
jgi:hypothetical protein